MTQRFSLYSEGPNNTIEIYPDWVFGFNCARLWHIKGYFLTEKPVEQKDLQIPVSQMPRLESEYQGVFIDFNKKRPRSCKREDRQYDSQKCFDFMDY